MEANKEGVFISYEELEDFRHLPEGLVPAALSMETFYEHLVEYWANGSYFTYRNEITEPLGEEFFIRVNNDGSEDLVELHYNDDKSWLTVIKKVTPVGEAKLWNDTIEKGFMTLQETKRFKRKK